jgi:hypothetical protein
MHDAEDLTPRLYEHGRCAILFRPEFRLWASVQVEDFVSQASATQRRGRAGRVRPGICFALYTRQRFDRMRPFQARL